MRVLRFIFAAMFCFGGAIQAGLINGITAVVNDTVITYEQVSRGIAPFDEQLIRDYRDDPKLLAQKRAQLFTDQIEELVERQLILAEFKRVGYNLPESFIDDAVRTEIRKNFYGDRATMAKTLQSKGITAETFRKLQREKIIVQYLTEQNTSAQKVLISPFKIEKFYTENQEQFKVSDQVKLRTILVGQLETAPPGTAKKLAEEILKKIEEGTSFAEMAAIYSEDRFRAEGGNRGWIQRGGKDLRKELEDAAFALKGGQRSGVIEFPDACFLIQVDEVRTAHVRPLDEVRAEIEKTLKDQESARLHKKWIERLRSKAYVQYY